MNLENLFPLEQSLAEYLNINALGKENAIVSKKLNMFGPGTFIRASIHRLRLAGLPICSCSKGYYWAETSTELKQTVDFIASYLRNLEDVHQAVLDTYYEMKTEEAKH